MLVIIVKKEKWLLICVYIKISRYLGDNFWNLGRNVWIFGNFLATFWHSSEQLSSILQAQSGKALPGVDLLSVKGRAGADMGKGENRRSFPFLCLILFSFRFALVHCGSYLL